MRTQTACTTDNRSNKSSITTLVTHRLMAVLKRVWTSGVSTLERRGRAGVEPRRQLTVAGTRVAGGLGSRKLKLSRTTTIKKFQTACSVGGFVKIFPS